MRCCAASEPSTDRYGTERRQERPERPVNLRMTKPGRLACGAPPPLPPNPRNRQIALAIPTFTLFADERPLCPTIVDSVANAFAYVQIEIHAILGFVVIAECRKAANI